MSEEMLFTKGFYVGGTTEIMPTETLDDIALDVQEFLNNKEKYFSVRSSTNDQDLPQQIPYGTKNFRKKLVKKMNLDLSQEWSEIISQDIKYTSLLKEIRSYVTLFAIKFYPTLSAETIQFRDTITLFENGDFIRMHHDGKNLGRICVLLIYLTDNPNSSYHGGELIIEEAPHTFVKVPPYKGTFVILDFTKHNVRHAVEKVTNNFERLCYISFIYDKKLIKEET